eukprot:TRINITY_DN5567_c3_g1_i1.p1 TRINITY_DN5567_c3_g1~~TRINITY_DN5567_c3_g1_i1.p1  ORF type:complete len:373 (-),score=69.71 TRINITY_DN5567_c3_g1_i1:92-1210(-)
MHHIFANITPRARSSTEDTETNDGGSASTEAQSKEMAHVAKRVNNGRRQKRRGNLFHLFGHQHNRSRNGIFHNADELTEYESGTEFIDSDCDYDEDEEPMRPEDIELLRAHNLKPREYKDSLKGKSVDLENPRMLLSESNNKILRARQRKSSNRRARPRVSDGDRKGKDILFSQSPTHPCSPVLRPQQQQQQQIDDILARIRIEPPQGENKQPQSPQHNNKTPPPVPQRETQNTQLRPPMARPKMRSSLEEDGKPSPNGSLAIPSSGPMNQRKSGSAVIMSVPNTVTTTTTEEGGVKKHTTRTVQEGVRTDSQGKVQFVTKVVTKTTTAFTSEAEQFRHEVTQIEKIVSVRPAGGSSSPCLPSGVASPSRPI